MLTDNDKCPICGGPITWGTDADTFILSCIKIPTEHIDTIFDNSKFEDFKSANGPCTVVIMTLPNGYSLVESSGCIDPKEYDHELGVQLCKDALRRRVWQLEGYLGKQKFYENKEETK